mmetsp:Transcript_18119/g.68678  ORF Transcript_18119/g.68678 Transcript_18119/m.68678 type:complete len:83 (-) Transcript_18119:19-267(-)
MSLVHLFGRFGRFRRCGRFCSPTRGAAPIHHSETPLGGFETGWGSAFLLENAAQKQQSSTKEGKHGVALIAKPSWKTDATTM